LQDSYRMSVTKDLIIVAGAGRGIGFSVVKDLLHKYPDKFVVAVSRNINKLNTLAVQFKNLKIIQADLSVLSDEDKKDLINSVKNKNLKSIIFTAGILDKVKFGEACKKDFEKIYTNNVWSFIDLVQFLMPEINQSTHIISIGSMGGFTGTLKFPEMFLYSSSKAALSSVTECIAVEISEKKASANCLVLGAVDTEMMNTAFPGYKTDISPDSISDFIIDFAMNRKNLFNGKVIPVAATIP
jgi:3-oxoacyl-[acyl-carrier protein] reductase